MTDGDPPIVFHRRMLPGGSELTPDNILTLDVDQKGRNIEMTSIWAFGRPKAKPVSTSEKAVTTS